MKKGECSSFILSRLDLHEIEDVVWEPYHRVGPCRPPRNPVGIFKALIIKRIHQAMCDVKAGEKPCHPSQLTWFRSCLNTN